METASCGWVRRFIGPWKDGELDPADAARIERHIAACAGCAAQARFERWFSGEVRRLVERPRAPERLAERVAFELRREHRRRSWRRAALAGGGLAAAAGLAAVLAVGLRGAPPVGPAGVERAAVEREPGAGGVAPSAPPAPPGFRLAGLQDGGPLAADVLDRHQRVLLRALPLELASADADEVAAWFRGKVPFPVVAPRFAGERVRLLGGRLTHVRERDAAYVGYDVDGHRLSLVIAPAGDWPLGGQRVYDVGGRTVFVSNRGSLTYALFRSGGLAYSLVSDLPEPALLELASQIPR